MAVVVFAVFAVCQCLTLVPNTPSIVQNHMNVDIDDTNHT